MNLAKSISTLLLACTIAGCATAVFNPARNLPLQAGTPVDMDRPRDFVGETVVALSFSGGGLRAAAFSAGVLHGLAEIKTPRGDLLDDVTFISSVSGGSLTSTYFALYGRDQLPRYREEVLYRDFERTMRVSASSPFNLLRLLTGGLNDRSNFAEALDNDVFRGATFADLYRRGRPDVWINASDLYHRTSFPFIPPLFNAICSDIRSYPLADAVAASMAVPLVFSPIVLKTYPVGCPTELQGFVATAIADPSAPRLVRSMALAQQSYRVPDRTQFVKLVDGGITDNFGLSSILISRSVLQTPYGPMSKRDAVRLRRLVFLIVDAGRGPSGDWTLSQEGPGGIDSALAATDAAIDAAARLAADSFHTVLSTWRDAIVTYRCSLTASELEALGGVAKGWSCSDVQFDLDIISVSHVAPPLRSTIAAIETRLALPRESIDAAIEGGRQATVASRVLRNFVQRLRNQPTR